MSERACLVFSDIRPQIVVAYALMAALCVMVSLVPLLATIAFFATLTLEAMIKGAPSALKRLSWQLLMIAVFAAINCLFIQKGPTLIFDGDFIDLHLESMLYGACAAMVIASAMNCFLLLSEMVSSDEALMMMGGRLPIISLLSSMTIRLVPKFRGRIKEVADIRKACTCSGAISQRGVHRTSASDMTHLLSASLEDSLICADSMKARGWGSCANRTFYSRAELGKKGKMLVAVVIISGCACFAIGAASSSGYDFYPREPFNIAFFGESFLEKMAFWGNGQMPALWPILYLIYAAYFFFPHIYLAIEGLKCHL